MKAKLKQWVRDRKLFPPDRTLYDNTQIEISQASQFASEQNAALEAEVVALREALENLRDSIGSNFNDPLRLLDYIDKVLSSSVTAAAIKDKWQAKAKQDTERLASWMIQNSYATGHGDSVAALVSELDWQHKERFDAAMAQKETSDAS